MNFQDGFCTSRGTHHASHKSRLASSLKLGSLITAGIFLFRVFENAFAAAAAAK
jgi:hypothetical protein